MHAPCCAVVGLMRWSRNWNSFAATPSPDGGASGRRHGCRRSEMTISNHAVAKHFGLGVDGRDFEKLSRGEFDDRPQIRHFPSRDPDARQERAHAQGNRRFTSRLGFGSFRPCQCSARDFRIALHAQPEGFAG